MKQRGGGGLNHAAHAKQDQPGIKAHDKAVVAADALHQRVADPFQGHELIQAVGAHGDVRDLPRDFRAVADGNAHIRGGQGRRIVDAVANHDHPSSVRFLPFHKGRLVLREHLGIVFVHPDPAGHRRRCPLAVPGHHHHLADAFRLQGTDDLSRLLPQGILNADHRRQMIVHGQIQMGIFLRKRSEKGFLSFRDRTFFILKHKMAASDHHALFSDGGGNSVGYHIFHLRVHFLVVQLLFLRRLHHGPRHGVGKMLLQAGGDAQQLIRRLAVKGDDGGHGGAGPGERARLVKDNGFRFRHGFQIFSSLYRHMVPSRFPDGGQHGNGHGKLQRAGKIHHQNGQRLCHVPGKEPHQNRSHESPGHQAVGKMLRLSFQRGLQLFRLFDHGDDLFKSAGTAHCLYTHGQLPFLHHASRIDGISGDAAHGDGFPGEGGLVHHGLPFLHQPVEGNHISHVDHHLIPFPDLRRGNQKLLISGFLPYPAHIQGHGPRQVVHRFFMRPFLQKLSHAEQEHDRRGGVHIPAEHGNADRHRIQDRNLDFPFCQRFCALFQIFYGFYRCNKRPQGPGDEQLRSETQQYLHHQLFLIPGVHFSSGIFDKTFRNLHPVIAEALQSFKDRRSVSPIADDRILRALIHLRFRHAVQLLQIIEQNVRLAAGHPVLNQMDSHPPFYFMPDPYFHRSLSSGPGALCRAFLRDIRRRFFLRLAFLVDRLRFLVDILRVFLNGGRRLHHARLRPQDRRRAVRVELLRVLAGKQLDPGGSEQNSCRKNSRFLRVNAFQTFKHIFLRFRRLWRHCHLICADSP